MASEKVEEAVERLTDTAFAERSPEYKCCAVRVDDLRNVLAGRDKLAGELASAIERQGELALEADTAQVARQNATARAEAAEAKLAALTDPNSETLAEAFYRMEFPGGSPWANMKASGLYSCQNVIKKAFRRAEAFVAAIQVSALSGGNEEARSGARRCSICGNGPCSIGVCDAPLPAPKDA